MASFSSQTVGFNAQGQADVCFDLTMQVNPARRRVDQAPEMGEVERRRGKAEQPVERGVHGLGLELDRRRGREHELPRAVVKFAIADAKVVAGEDAAAAAIDHGDVVTGVARRIQAEQFAPGQDRDETVVRLDDTRGIDRNDLAIKAPGGFNTVNRLRSGDQLRWIDHVPRTARMHQKLGRRESLHHRAGAAGMVEVHVGEDDPVDGIHRQA